MLYLFHSTLVNINNVVSCLLYFTLLPQTKGLFTYDVSAKWRGPEPPSPPCQQSQKLAGLFHKKNHFDQQKKLYNLIFMVFADTVEPHCNGKNLEYQIN